MNKLEKILSKWNFKKIAAWYLILAVVAGLACVGTVGFIYRERLNFAWQYSRLEEAKDESALKTAVDKTASASADVVDVLILDGGNQVTYSAKNSEFASGTLELVKSGSEKKYLTSAEHPDAVFQYVKGEEFANELILAIRNGTTAEFKEKYRQADLLAVDDIQFIAGKESTQEEFFHTFNKLYEEHKQIVMTSDRKPSDMLTLEDRLKTRFEWGLLADIQPPDYETRMAILKNKAKNLGLNLSDDVCNYIAINVTNNVRQIEGTVKKILAYRDLNNMPLDLPNISRAIDDMFKSEGNALPTPSLIISQVCKFYSIDEVLLRGTQKNKGTAEARQIAMYLIRKLTNLSLPDIGKEFARDHSTVLYAIRKVEVALKNGDTTMQNNIRDITANINSCL